MRSFLSIASSSGDLMPKFSSTLDAAAASRPDSAAAVQGTEARQPKADMSRPLLLRCAATAKIYGTGAWRNSYSPAWAANVSMTAIFGNRFDGRPYRSFRYSGLLYESQTFP